MYYIIIIIIIIIIISTEGVRESSTEGVRESSTEGVRESSTEGVRESSTEGVRESSTQGVRESSTEGVRESGSQGLKDSGTQGRLFLLTFIYHYFWELTPKPPTILTTLSLLYVRQSRISSYYGYCVSSESYTSNQCLLICREKYNFTMLR